MQWYVRYVLYSTLRLASLMYVCMNWGKPVGFLSFSVVHG